MNYIHEHFRYKKDNFKFIFGNSNFIGYQSDLYKDILLYYLQFFIMQEEPSENLQMQQLNQSQNEQLDTVSLNHFYKWNAASNCNFCSEHKNIKWAYTQRKYFGKLDGKIHPYTLQLMMDHGWVRCGDYYYKSNVQQSCCKKWGIQNNITKFIPKKSQIKTMKKMMKLFALKKQEKQMMIEKKESKKKSESKIKPEKQKNTAILTEQQQKLIKDTCEQINNQIKDKIMGKVSQFQGQMNFNIFDKLKVFPSGKGFKGFGYSNYCMLLYGLNKKKFSKQYSMNQFVKDIKQIVEKTGKQLNTIVEVEHGGYLIFLSSQKVKQEIKKMEDKNQMKFNIQQKKTKKKQSMTQDANLNSSQANQKQQPTCQLTITHNLITFGRLRIQIVPSQIKDDDFHIYQRFSKAVHKKDIQTIQRYVDFLCIDGLYASVKQPLPENIEGKFYQPVWDPNQEYQKKKPVQKNPKLFQGCYQMKYYLDGKKIAVGFADILPNLYVSDYFFYEPQYRDYRIGVFSAMIQIEYVRYLNLCFPQLTQYTMMSYVQSANNMAYKNQFQPMQILCPVTGRFVQFTAQIKERIDKIIKRQIESVRLAPQGIEINPDIVFNDLEMWILQNTNFNYYGKKCKLIELIGEMNLEFIVYILTIYVPQWGKKVHERLIFQYIDESI